MCQALTLTHLRASILYSHGILLGKASSLRYSGLVSAGVRRFGFGQAPISTYFAFWGASHPHDDSLVRLTNVISTSPTLRFTL